VRLLPRLACGASIVSTLVASFVVALPAKGPVFGLDEFTAIGHSTLDIGPNGTGTGFVYCIHGAVTTTGRVAGTWVIRVTGTRGATPYASGSTSPSATYDNGCPTISKAGAAEGLLTIDVAYIAAGGSAIAHSAGFAQWSPAAGDQTFAQDFTP
jgi:hypothetical protein